MCALQESPFGQLTYLRVYSGVIRKGEVVVHVSTGKKIKVCVSNSTVWLIRRRVSRACARMCVSACARERESLCVCTSGRVCF